ncbi:MAG: C10 family peptidase [Muribaculaceae bacterium]|nr:C10 family peptidase [Muribaculaceae bacterium]
MKPTVYYLAPALGILLLSGCSNDCEDGLINEPEVMNQDAVYEFTVPDTIKEVTDAKAMDVARMFMASNSDSRATVRAVESVNTIYGDDGTPQMYVVNYAANQGYVIVSASKDYYPVIAYSDEGRFSMETSALENTANGWIAEQKAMIKNAHTLSDDTKRLIAKAWTDYNTNKIRYNLADSRTSREKPQAYFDSLHMWEGQNGVEVYLWKDYILTTEYQLLSTEEKRDIIAQLHYFGQTEENNSVIVLRRGKSLPQIKFNYINSKWHQQAPYNSFQYDSYPLGCTTIAAGMVMRHHQYPANINWDNMPENYYTAPTGLFLYDLAVRIGVEFGPEESPGKSDNLATALRNYGYSVSIEKKHTLSDVQNQLSAGNPVIMIGTDPVEGCHAWVCDGYDWFSSWSTIDIMTLDYSEPGEIPNEMFPLWSKEGPRSMYTRYHMCWGWGASMTDFIMILT